jgi:L-amino acid N-acyltransferase YncA
MITIRQASELDQDAVWDIFHVVVAAGDTYVFDPDTPRDQALAYWFHAGTRTYVAESDGRVVGTYILKPNQPGLGAHGQRGLHGFDRGSRTRCWSGHG